MGAFRVRPPAFSALPVSYTHLTWCSVDLTGPIALVIGSEGFGVSRLVKEKCDFILSLPMKGHINSLNASVACGVLCYEAARQRAGIAAFRK